MSADALAALVLEHLADVERAARRLWATGCREVIVLVVDAEDATGNRVLRELGGSPPESGIFVLEIPAARFLAVVAPWVSVRTAANVRHAHGAIPIAVAIAGGASLAVHLSSTSMGEEKVVN